MLPTPTASDLTEVTAQAIRDRRPDIESFPRMQKECAGRFANIAGAVVAVELRIDFAKAYFGTRDDRNTVQLTAAVKCHGHGCLTPTHELPATAKTSLFADADTTGALATPTVAPALQWAQQHAETCRAMPFNDR